MTYFVIKYSCSVSFRLRHVVLGRYFSVLPGPAGKSTVSQGRAAWALRKLEELPWWAGLSGGLRLDSAPRETRLPNTTVINLVIGNRKGAEGRLNVIGMPLG